MAQLSTTWKYSAVVQFSRQQWYYSMSNYILKLRFCNWCPTTFPSWSTKCKYIISGSHRLWQCKMHLLWKQGFYCWSLRQDLPSKQCIEDGTNEWNESKKTRARLTSASELNLDQTGVLRNNQASAIRNINSCRETSHQKPKTDIATLVKALWVPCINLLYEPQEIFQWTIDGTNKVDKRPSLKTKEQSNLGKI